MRTTAQWVSDHDNDVAVPSPFGHRPPEPRNTWKRRAVSAEQRVVVSMGTCHVLSWTGWLG
ncbi:MAG: hypothetical protein K0Q93_921 [Nocardioidaceae bacterium]|nr:hypothetical protein [Nocardioidaceae bacterium]